jgi:SAM-dependent methyltransferase
MLAELLARTGQKMLGDVPPNGRDYWAGRYWDRAAAEAHPLLADAFHSQKEAIAGYLRRYGRRAGRGLEFACGTGEFTRLTAELTPVREMVAVDISASALEITRGRVRHDNLTLIHGDFWAGHELGRADLVLCADAIHHLGDVRRVLERLHGFVAPGGVLLGNVWTADHYHEFQRKRYGALKHIAYTSMFLSTAMLIRLSAGRLRTGFYRTQLLPSATVERHLQAVFSEVLDITVERYFTSFAVRQPA